VAIKKLDILSIDCDWIRCERTQQDFLSFVIPFLFNNSNIVLAYNHDKIIPIFEHGYDEYNLYNIDHHHDYAYNDHVNLYEGNWLYHISTVFPKKINYLWINNPDSEHPMVENIRKMHKTLKSYKFDQNISCIPKQKFDKIFICCSPELEYSAHFGITAYKIIERIINDKSNK
jgi:hypothetical protein|tara:strand:- start:181 stop:699 length:519 start_codon:yes stop_codon:yes gene_type:complete